MEKKMTIGNEIFSQLREIKEEAKRKYRVRDLAVFGSVARGEQTETSDVDVLADFEDDATLFDLTGLGLFLEEKLGRKVDVVPKRSLRKEIRDTVLHEARMV